MNKKISDKDKEDWENFLKNKEKIPNKDFIVNKKIRHEKIKKIDLHGFTLQEANEKVKEVILSAADNKYKEILLITGKGLHSNTDTDAYVSKNLSKLKFSVPEFINNNNDINKYILSISKAPIKDGGDGAILIKLKNL